MKKIKLLLVVAVLLATGLVGCKKGENDPFLSLRTRDARISGEWILNNVEGTYVESETFEGATISYTETYTYSGGVLTSTDSDGDISSEVFNLEFVINKDGSYERTSTEGSDNSSNTGNWWWLSDNKKKTRIAFDDDLDSFEVDRLTNKELVLIQKTKYSDTDTDGYVYTEENERILTFEKK